MTRDLRDVTGGPAMAALLSKAGGAHKYGYGHALILAGGPGHGGAARLAARAALRMGAGLVTLACPAAALVENSARLDAVMVRALDGPAALGQMLEDPRFTALCLGPGLGLGEGSRRFVAAGLSRGCAVVLDADALSSHADDPEALFVMCRMHQNVVMTPHGGEFARLFPGIRLGESHAARVQAAREAAALSGAVVLLKGAHTVIAAPDGTARVHLAEGARAAPWLATAGSGDVLAGFITGLLARGIAPLEAAATAVYLHVDCARAFGPGLIAEDLPEMLPRVMREMNV